METLTIILLVASLLIVTIALAILFFPTFRFILWALFIALPSLLIESVWYDLTSFFKSLRKQTLIIEGEIIEIKDEEASIPGVFKFDTETNPYSLMTTWFGTEKIAKVTTSVGVISVSFGGLIDEVSTLLQGMKIKIKCNKYCYDYYYHCTKILAFE